MNKRMLISVFFLAVISIFLARAADASMTFGFESAPLTIHMYGDASGQFDARFFQNTYPYLYKTYIAPGYVKIQYNTYAFGAHPYSDEYARASYCAGLEANGFSFPTFMSWLYNNNGQNLTASYLEDAATASNISPYNLVSCYNRQSTEEAVQAQLKAGKESGIFGEPTFIVGKYLIVGSQSANTFDTAIRSALNQQGEPSIYSGSGVPSSTIIAFIGMNETFAHTAWPQIQKVLKDNPDTKLVIRNAPLSGSLDNSYALSVIDECIYAKYGSKAVENYITRLMASYNTITESNALGVASSFGYDVKSCADNRTYMKEVIADKLDAEALGIKHFPAFIIKGQIVSGSMSASEYESYFQLPDTMADFQKQIALGDYYENGAAQTLQTHNKIVSTQYQNPPAIETSGSSSEGNANATVGYAEPPSQNSINPPKIQPSEKGNPDGNNGVQQGSNPSENPLQDKNKQYGNANLWDNSKYTDTMGGCTPGSDTYYTCSDGSQIKWCICEMGSYHCLPSPETECTQGSQEPAASARSNENGHGLGSLLGSFFRFLFARK